MLPRPLIIATLLGGAVGVPYPTLSGTRSGAGGTSAAPAPVASTLAAAASLLAATPAAVPLTSGATLQPLTSYPLIEQVLRFDITKEWVYRQWARKSTWPTDVGLYGVRVQLVTGTQPSALAGSLTYFFNAHGQVEHISFRGRTGDPAPLAAFLARTYELQPAYAPAGEHLYQVKQGDRVKSEFRARPDAVTTGATPTSGFAVELELARPNSQRLLPQRPTPFAAQPSLAAAPVADASGSQAADGEDSAIKKYFKSYFDDARFATPEEESQVIWRRWPN